MVSKRRLDDRSIKRRGPTRDPKRRILVVCEGRETERGYFKAFQHDVRNPRVHVEISKETGVPLTVVQTAIRLRDEAAEEARSQRDDNLSWDEVWGVFDIDAHPNVPEAKELARKGAVSLAISNPCFELWALLHFQDQRAHIERSVLRAELQEHLVDYDKSLEFSKLRANYDAAVTRAKSLDAEAARLDDEGRNPTTGVHRLTESIRSGGY